VRFLDCQIRRRPSVPAGRVVGPNALTPKVVRRFAARLLAQALSVAAIVWGDGSAVAQAPPLPPAPAVAEPILVAPLPAVAPPLAYDPVGTPAFALPAVNPPATVTLDSAPPVQADPSRYVDMVELLRRLERQESELKELRRQVEQGGTASFGPPATPYLPAPAPMPSLVATPDPTSPFNLASQPKDSDAADKKVDDKPVKKEPAFIDLSTEKWTVKLGGHVQLDYINWATASPQIVPVGVTPGAQDYFEFRRLRLVADGTGYGVYDFRLQMTLEPETIGETANVTSPDVKDAYFSINELPLLGRWRIGNFFVPFGLEQVTNDPNNVFLERSIPTQGVFTADREVGMAAYNCTEDRRLTWTTGVFFDGITESLKERIDDNQGYRLSGRATYLPYYDEASGGRYLVHTGIGVLRTDDQDHRLRVRSRPQIHEGPRLIDSLSLVGNTQTTGNLEGAIVWGSVTLQSEAYMSMLDLAAGSQVVNGQYVHLSWFLTGENRIFEKFGQHGPQFGRNAPFNNVFAVRGGRSFGAIEAKARWSRLDLTNVNAGQYNDFTLGFNWYWSDRVRMMFDWIHPFTTADANPFGAVQANILGTRFDFNW
jgi:phosphate-selective porin OprO and OprP